MTENSEHTLTPTTLDELGTTVYPHAQCGDTFGYVVDPNGFLDLNNTTTTWVERATEQPTGEEQYLALVNRVLDVGVMIPNERTGYGCLTVIDGDMTYDCSDSKLHILTTRKMNTTSAIGEFLGYLRGYDSAAQFRAIGCNTWNANANENKAWLANPARKGEDDMGRAYGPQLRDWKAHNGKSIDHLRMVYEDLRQGIDNRSEIMTFLNPGERDIACLNSCMHTHTFSILGGTLYLTSYQRSSDVLLGTAFNMVQCCWFLLVMAKITGLRPGKVFHKNVNVHIYENQLDKLMSSGHLDRAPYDTPTLTIPDRIKTLDDLLSEETHPNDFVLSNYQHHEAISYPFAV